LKNRIPIYEQSISLCLTRNFSDWAAIVTVRLLKLFHFLTLGLFVPKYEKVARMKRFAELDQLLYCIIWDQNKKNRKSLEYRDYIEK